LEKVKIGIPLIQSLRFFTLVFYKDREMAIMLPRGDPRGLTTLEPSLGLLIIDSRRDKPQRKPLPFPPDLIGARYRGIDQETRRRLREINAARRKHGIKEAAAGDDGYGRERLRKLHVKLTVELGPLIADVYARLGESREGCYLPFGAAAHASGEKETRLRNWIDRGYLTFDADHEREGHRRFSELDVIRMALVGRLANWLDAEEAVGWVEHVFEYIAGLERIMAGTGK
jgi:hypothetical protein